MHNKKYNKITFSYRRVKETQMANNIQLQKRKLNTMNFNIDSGDYSNATILVYTVWSPWAPLPISTTSLVNQDPIPSSLPVWSLGCPWSIWTLPPIVVDPRAYGPPCFLASASLALVNSDDPATIHIYKPCVLECLVVHNKHKEKSSDTWTWRDTFHIPHSPKGTESANEKLPHASSRELSGESAIESKRLFTKHPKGLFLQ